MKSMSKIITTGIVVVFVILAIWGWLALSQQVPEGAEGPWGGVDVTVIEQYAVDAGREAREPFINTNQGDLLLFVFALGGAVGGFVAGYYWRRLIAEKTERRKTAS
ncbi:MAG: cobalt transporter [Dehalococcoidia bacterium]|nr:cobalt transporter [Dehalococcoidia bacterium]